jgi:sugar/nucleoside kinase (ribokinase family)
MSGLLQLSGAIVDLVYKPGRLPRSGEEVESKISMMTAGGGFNALVAAKRQGAVVTYGGTLGIGPFATMVEEALMHEGIAIATHHRLDVDQGSCVVLVEDNGERSFVTHHGAERHCSLAHLEALQANQYGWLLLTGYSLYAPASAAVFATWLRQLPRGARLLFDPGPTVGEIAEEYLNAALVRADWLSLNEAEAGMLAPGLAAPQAAEHLSKGRVGAIVRSGRKGCHLALAGQAAINVPGFEVDAIDSNGAGDSHDGAFIAAMLAHGDAVEACLQANAAAALSTLQVGPATAPSAADVLQFRRSREGPVPHGARPVSRQN